jgi:hypothetical protein
MPARTDFPRQHRGPFPHTAHQRCRFPDPERLPPMSPVRLAPSLALRAGLVGPPLVPRLSRLGPASDMRSLVLLRARPDRLAGYSPELRGHMPPIDFCSCQNFRARPRTPRLQLHTSRRDESHRAVDSPLLAEERQPNIDSSGVAAPGVRPHNPRDDVHTVDRGFTPTCSNSDTRCRALTRVETRKKATTGDPMEVRRPLSRMPSLGPSNSKGRHLRRIFGELARRARRAEALRALKGRLTRVGRETFS